MSVELSQTGVVARDSVDVIVTISNPGPDPITLRGANTCIVSEIRVEASIGDSGPVPFDYRETDLFLDSLLCGEPAIARFTDPSAADGDAGLGRSRVNHPVPV